MISLVLLLGGCVAFNQALNAPISTSTGPAETKTPPIETDTAIALAFSGGGTRAAAFALGVLQGLDRIPARGGKSELDRVAFVSGVSGGSVAAAYFGLKGRAALSDFRERFLIRDAEAALRTDVSLGSLAQGLEGGLNGASRLSGWLDQNLFDGATMGELERQSGPVVWLNASDLYYRTPFLFSSTTFNALCSDLKRFPVSQAVAASAAVPVVFTPIVLESFPQACADTPPAWIGRVLADRNAGAQVKAFAQALVSYRNPDQTRYLKLADGGLTDNFGLSGLVIARAAATNLYAPLTARDAVRLRKVTFVVVNAGRPPKGDWSRTIEGPAGADLLSAITDTAIDSSVRSGFDAFRLTLREWEAAARKWRCGLALRDARALGAGNDWRCSNISFEITEVSFAGSVASARLAAIPTRFKLPADDVDLLIRAGQDAVIADPVLNDGLRVTH